MFPKIKTHRSEKYKEYIRGLECEAAKINEWTICVNAQVPHHTETGGTGIKGSDLSCIPLCFGHHNEVHKIGKESFSKKYNLNYNEIIVRCLQGYIEEVEGKK